MTHDDQEGPAPTAGSNGRRWPEGEPRQGSPTPERSEQAQQGEPAAAATDSDVEAHARTVWELEDRWRRALADLDNLRKRYERELRREREAERARATEAWLSVVDDIERTLAHAEASPETLVTAVRAVRDQAVALLARLGYPRHDEVGVPFDPARHEVVTVVDDADAPPGTVVDVLRAGYGESDHQLRPAAVAVSRRE